MKQTYRFARYLACAGLIAGTLSLWGCGSASTFDPITPTRIVAFGDALVDVGQAGRTVTINGNVTDVNEVLASLVAGLLNRDIKMRLGTQVPALRTANYHTTHYHTTHYTLPLTTTLHTHTNTLPH